jgi:hypothetical protein
MFRTSLLSCAVALPLCLIGFASAASAHTNVDIHLGVPFYPYQAGPHYRYYRGYGWYDAYRYPRFHGGYYYGDDVAAYPDRLSCGAARRIVHEHGFYRIEPCDCSGRDYSFYAVRNGYRMIVFVNSYTGEVWKG